MRRIETSIWSCQPGLLRQSSRSSLLEVVAAALGRLLVPARPVEAREVRRLPVVRLVGVDAHHLVAVARPVDRPVVLVPGEAHRVVRPEPLGERLVVEPRLAAVGDRGQRQRAGQRHAEQRGDARARAAAAAARATGSRRSARRSPRRAAAAACRRARRPARRRARAARRARGTGTRGAPPPRGQQASCADSVSSSAPPISSAARGHGSAPSYGIRTVPSDCAPLDDAVDQLAPVARLEVLEVDPRHGERREQARRRRGRQRRACTSAPAPARRRSPAPPAAVAAATHSSARPELSPATIRCHSSAPSEASAAKPSSRAAHSGSSASGPRSDVLTAPIPSPSGAARCAGSCRSASWAARRRTRSGAGRRRRTAGRARTSGSPPPARRTPRGPWRAR